MLTHLLCLGIVLVFLFDVVVGSAVTTYTDAKCKTSFSNLDVINGYPDGVCTPLKITRNLQSFQVARLDPGCAVTLYGADEGPLMCSSSLKIVAEMATCYNSSWIYYSIDGCLQPTSSSIILPTATSTPASNFSAPATTSTSPPPPGLPQIKDMPIGAIIGGIIGLIAVITLAAGFGLFTWKRRRGRLAKDSPSPPSYELSNEHALLEAANSRPRFAEEKDVNYPEMWGHEVAREMGRNSTYIPPAELPGDGVVRGEGKGEVPSLKFHTAR